MAKRKLKKKVKYGLLIIVLLIVSVIVVSSIIKTNKLHKTIEYKLSEKGYNENEIETIKKLSDKTRDFLLEQDFNKYYMELISAKYYIDSNFKTYLTYHNQEDEMEVDMLVPYVNTESYKEEYEQTVEADVSDPILALVNKNHYLPKTYKPSDLKNVSNWYAYDGIKLSDTAYQPFMDLFNAAKKENLTIVLNGGYRTYKEQNEYWTTLKDDGGERYADETTTRPGYAESQLGLRISIDAYYHAGDIQNTKEYEWMIEHAHEYGFIQRYPKGKEYITKYDFYPELFRYVGVEAATIIHNENLCLEEYVAYYLK